MLSNVFVVLEKKCNNSSQTTIMYFRRNKLVKSNAVCQSSWFKHVSWLHYDQEKDAVLCLKHNEKLTAEHNKEDTYVSTRTFSSWKKAPACFNAHQMLKMS